MDKAPKYLVKYNLDLIIVAGFPYIFSLDLINVPNIACINLHAGRLPDYRGGSPLNWQIINDEKRIYVSIIKMDKGIDSGPVIKSGNLSDKAFLPDAPIISPKIKMFIIF